MSRFDSVEDGRERVPGMPQSALLDDQVVAVGRDHRADAVPVQRHDFVSLHGATPTHSGRGIHLPRLSFGALGEALLGSRG
jgi:hypothetical protein